MSNTERLYFRRTGDESHAYVLVRLYDEGGATKAEASIKGPMTEAADYEDLPASGDAATVLQDVSEVAGLRGLDVRIELDGVEWPNEIGSLVG